MKHKISAAELADLRKSIKLLARELPIYPRVILNHEKKIIEVLKAKRVYVGWYIINNPKLFQNVQKRDLQKIDPNKKYTVDEYVLTDPHKLLLAQALAPGATKEKVENWIAEYKLGYERFLKWQLKENAKSHGEVSHQD